MRTWWLTFAVAVMLATLQPNAAIAVDDELSAFTQSAYASPMSREQRIELAEAGYAYWKAASDSLPRNSAATVAYLRAAETSGDADNYKRVMQTPEYTLQLLVDLVESCTAKFEKLKTPPSGLIEELAEWTAKTDECFDVRYLLDLTEQTKTNIGYVLLLSLAHSRMNYSVPSGIIDEYEECFWAAYDAGQERDCNVPRD